MTDETPIDRMTCRWCSQPIEFSLEDNLWLDDYEYPDACADAPGALHMPLLPLDTPPDLSDVEAIEDWLESGA